MRNNRVVPLLLSSVLVVMLAPGCKKKAPPPPPPPAPAPAEVEAPRPATPTATLTAEPSSIERGQSATLRWSSTNADSAELNQGIGAVAASGSRAVSPGETTTYTVTVRGRGGEAVASASVTVRSLAPPPPPPVARGSFSQELAGRVRDAYFDYDKFDVRVDAQQTLSANAEALRALLQEFPEARIVIEGHCDERGSPEYNLGLGDRRAAAAKEFLAQLGVPADRLNVISYGKERPQCVESDEGCWQRNRRAHFAPGQ